MFRTFAMPAALALSLLVTAGSAQQADAGSESQQTPADSNDASSSAPVPGSLGSGGTVASGLRANGFTFGGTLPMSPANAFVSYFDARYVNDNAGEVDGTDVVNGSLTGADIADGSISGDKIANDSLTASDLAAGSVGTSEIADGSVTANDLGIQSVTNAKIAINAVTGLSVADGSLTGADIADNSITSADIGASAVGSSELAINSVTGSHIQSSTIGSSDILDNSLTSSDLASSSVGYSEIQFDCIRTDLLDPIAQNWAFNAGSYSNVDMRVQAVDTDSFAHGLYVEFSTEYVGGYVISASKNSGDHEFRVDSEGNVFADGTYSSAGAFASLIETTEEEREHLRGDVLSIDPSNPRAVRLSRGARSTLVAGVYAEKLGMLSSHREFDRIIEADPNGVAFQEGGALQNNQPLSMRDMYDFYSEIPAATSGIVEVRVSAENGAIMPGDLLVTAWTPGHAMRDANPKVGTVLGKALGELQSGTGLIEVLITLD